MWKCEVCNYIHNGDEALDKCPKCGAPKEKFNEINGENKEKIERSRFTNSLLRELITMMEEVQQLAIEGIEDDLDPGCRKAFTDALEAAEIIKQTSTAEINNHVAKGKWG